MEIVGVICENIEYTIIDYSHEHHKRLWLLADPLHRGSIARTSAQPSHLHVHRQCSVSPSPLMFSTVAVPHCHHELLMHGILAQV